MCRWSLRFHKVRLRCFFELYFKLSSSGKLPLPCAGPAEFVVSDTTSAQTEPRKTAGLDPSQGCRRLSDRRSPACFLYCLWFLQPESALLCSTSIPGSPGCAGWEWDFRALHVLPPSRYPGFLMPQNFPPHRCLCLCISWMTLSSVTQTSYF